MRDRIKPPCTYVNKILSDSPKLPLYGEGVKRDVNRKEEVRSDRRRRWGLPLSWQSSRGPSTLGEQGVRIVSDGRACTDNFLWRHLCGMQQTRGSNTSHSLPFMLRALLVSSILRGQTKRSDRTTSVATDVLSERKGVHCRVLMGKLM